MHSYVSSLTSDLSPGLAFALIVFVAAALPYLALCQTTRGRARSAIAYLLGLAAGLAATVASVAVVSSHGDAQAIVGGGLMASFFSPFFGMLRAKWQRKSRPARRKTVMEGFSR